MRSNETPKITVAIRKRPLNKKELARGESDIVKVSPNGEVLVCEYKQKVDLTKYIEETTFAFDYAFDESSSNELIYEHTIRPLIGNAFEGAKISCFAYGQTGSGKTYTMKGDMQRKVPGLYYLAAQEIFNYLKHPEYESLRVDVSFFEIYCGKLFDLLNRRNELKIREDKKANINVIGLEERIISSPDDFLTLIEEGSNLRVTSQNATNADSSRSHAILQINLKANKKVFSKISFIDLAGNERGADHMDQSKQTKIDGAEINKSLLSLKECIRALDQGKGHTPFRGSKLTMVLKDSFVGFCKTVMIGNVSPNVQASQNTMNTLRYADRVKELKRANDQTESLTKEEHMAREMMLPRGHHKNIIKVNISSADDEEDIQAKMDQARKQNYLHGMHNKNKEEKMDVEEPIPSKPPIPLIARKADNVPLQFDQKRPKVGKRISYTMQQQLKSAESLTMPRESSSQKLPSPMHARNVIQHKLDQNNLNSGNVSSQESLGSSQSLFKDSCRFNQQIHRLPNPNFQKNLQMNRNHSDGLASLQSYMDTHEQFLKEEMTVMKGETYKKEQLKNSLEPKHQLSEANEFICIAEQSIKQKINILNNMQTNLEKMKSAMRETAQIAQRIKQLPNTNYHNPPVAAIGGYNMAGAAIGSFKNIPGATIGGYSNVPNAPIGNSHNYNNAQLAPSNGFSVSTLPMRHNIGNPSSNHMQVGFAAMSHMAQQNPNNMAQQNSHNMTHKYTLHSSNNYLDDQLLEELSTDPMLF